MADALAALQAARKALVKVDGEKPGPQEPAVKPSPNGKVDATEPSGLSKTGASTMAFAVDAVLLLAAGVGVVLLAAGVGVVLLAAGVGVVLLRRRAE